MSCLTMSGSPEIRTYFGRCRCCLDYGYLKNMWEEYQWQEEKEIYVEMLVQCFALSWEHSEESKDQDQICDNCIVQLRNACNFKKTILQSQEQLLGHINNEGSELAVKIEQSDIIIKEETEHDELATTSGYLDDSGDNECLDSDDPDYVVEDDEDSDDFNHNENFLDADTSQDADASNDMEYQEVEYLETEDNQDIVNNKNKTETPERRKKAPRAPKTGKWPEKLPKSERFKTYKQYTEEALRKCIEAVRNEEMTPLEASKTFNIPKKTICAKVKMEPNIQEATSVDERTEAREKMYQFIQEVKNILTYTNAIIYKSKAHRIHCAYCPPENPDFMEPEDLRVHNRTQHITDRITKLENAFKPYYNNEIVKIDIENLTCNICCVAITSWNDMFRHLKKQHNIVLDQAYTRVIPYVLKSEVYICALCKDNFANFLQLDTHMNAHYNNYICEDCGSTFLSANRLKQHKKIHVIGKYRCKYCSKTFSLENYRRKHIELVHKPAEKFKCKYCDRKFVGEYLRHLHVVEEHQDQVKPITCEDCGRTFTWRPYYIKHVKRKHMEDGKKHNCNVCDKKFYLPCELKEHMLKHTGDKGLNCRLCGKSFVGLSSLKLHYKKHMTQLEKHNV